MHSRVDLDGQGLPIPAEERPGQMPRQPALGARGMVRIRGGWAGPPTRKPSFQVVLPRSSASSSVS
jgi:hypothetical protein